MHMALRTGPMLNPSVTRSSTRPEPRIRSCRTWSIGGCILNTLSTFVCPCPPPPSWSPAVYLHRPAPGGTLLLQRGVHMRCYWPFSRGGQCRDAAVVCAPFLQYSICWTPLRCFCRWRFCTGDVCVRLGTGILGGPSAQVCGYTVVPLIEFDNAGVLVWRGLERC